MTDSLEALKILKKRAREVADEHGFTLLHFGVEPSDDETASHVQLVVEYDPEKANRPSLKIVQVQVDQAMTEELEKAAKERLDKEVEDIKARHSDPSTDLSEHVDLQKKLRGKGGFLD